MREIEHEGGDYYKVEEVDARIANIIATDSTRIAQLEYRIAELERISAEYIARTDPLLDRLEPLSDRIHDLESALRELLQDTQHVDHNCGDGPDLCPVLNAREVLARTL